MPATRDPTPDPLSAYRTKRSLERTPEPAGTVVPGAGRLFVVHKHAARNLHYDLRLEMEGVLRSWAVPKGPSLDPSDKRLAVLVEDHPLEYGDFEGRIPEGNYGAGAVIVWDRGEWVPVGDPLEGLKKGKLLFHLKGYKLQGLWTLVKIKKAQKDWLLIKERDSNAASTAELPQGSVLSGLTVEDLRDSRDPGERVRQELLRLRAPEAPVDPGSVQLMLAETRPTPFTKPGWCFELKLDGYRLIVAREKRQARLLTRNGRDAAATFPEIARAVAALPFDLVLDGEVVALDESGRPSFQRLQQRGKLTRPLDVRHAAVEIPTTFYGFDLLGFEGFDLRSLPLVKRKELLRQVLPAAGALRYLEHFEETGELFYAEVLKLQLEGIMAKKADAPYRGGRSPMWLKIKADRVADFVVVGFTEPKGSRGGFGALHLADYVEGKLVYAGRAGSGFTSRQLKEVREVLEASRRATPPCGRPWVGGTQSGESLTRDDIKRLALGDTTWVQPAVVCEVRYKEWTDEGVLRHPVFLRFRDDKPIEDCVRQGVSAPLEEPLRLVESPRETRHVQLSNLDKVFWPEEGYTKGDLIEYYRTIAPWLLPYLRNRPVVLTRFPDGINGKSFFQKDAPKFAPDWMRTERMWSEQARREIDYFICDDETSLLYIANMASIPLHIWASRVDSLGQPDWCILDLDPKGAPFSDVVKVARALHELCDRLDLPNFVKTSGSSGLHVMVPLGRQCTHEQARSLGELLARVAASELPDIATIRRVVSQRDGRVYIDFLQNGHGRLLVAPYSVRPLPGAPVSVPLSWNEVTGKLDIRRYTIRTVPDRVRRMKSDPLLPVLDLAPDLSGALERLVKGVNNKG